MENPELNRIYFVRMSRALDEFRREFVSFMNQSEWFLKLVLQVLRESIGT